MYLINVRTRLLEEFHANIPKYAILSHTWGTDEEEISFRDIKSGFISKPGLGTVKFEGCLRQAKADGLSYVWIDTCCIDKTNANELGEAINSMFRWYQAAKTCYAFLQDVPSKDESAWKTRFRKSRWFTRGWTLQELLAPSELMFYSSDWRALGTKLQLSSVVGGITGIPAQFLLGASNLREASVAQRMSWASRRQTKRVEDIAYSLLGIFNVMIPMIYGEGTQAFIRLQQEIINATTDDSILAWDLSSKVVTFDPQSRPRNLFGGILATSPAAFAECGKITSGEHRTPTIEQGISRGYLKLQLPLYSGPLGETYGLLNCSFEDDDGEKVVGIPLSRVAPGDAHDEYIRPRDRKATPLPDIVPGTPASSIQTLALIGHDEARAKDCQYGFSIENTLVKGLELIDVWPADYWDEKNAFIYTGLDFHQATTQRTWARFRRSKPGSDDFILALELESTKTSSLARCHVMIASKETSLNRVVGAPLAAEYTFGKSSAYNGSMSIQTKLSQKQRGAHLIYNVKLTSRTSPPKDTVNLTSEIELLDHNMNVQSIFQESQEITPQLNSLNRTMETESARLDATKARLDDVQRQLDQLEAEKKMLVKKKERSAKKLESSSLEKENFASREKKLLETLSIAQKVQSASGENRASKWQDSIVTYLSTDLFKAKTKDKAAYNTEGIQSMENVLQKTFLQAVVKGNIAAMQFLKDSLPSLDFNDSEGRGALGWAIVQQDLSAVTWLLDNGLSVDTKDGDDKTPLSWACSENFLLGVRLLLSRGAQTEDMDPDGWRPLHIAVSNDDLSLTRWLLDHGADIQGKSKHGSTAFELAVSEKSISMVNLLLDRGADLEEQNSLGATALCRAAKHDHSHDSALLRALIDRGAKIKATSKKGWTPLHFAARYGVTEAVELLLKQGADTTAKTLRGSIPLKFATRNKRGSGPLRRLLDHGSSVETIESMGGTFLALAASCGCAESIKLLLDRGVPIESTDADGLTALANAAQAGNKKTAEALIKQNAKVDCKDSDGMTALALAAQGGHASLVALLVEGGARVDQKDDTNGRTALHWAVLKDQTSAIEELLKRGADIEATSKAGHTAIFFAIRNGLEASFKLLLKKGASLNVEGPKGKIPLSYARSSAKKDEEVGSSPAMKEIIKYLEKAEKQTREKDGAKMAES